MALSPAIFLDKDGTVLQDVPYNVKPAEMRFASGAAEGLEALAGLGLPLFIVSNQPGIAFGRFDFRDLRRMFRHLRGMFKEVGAELTACYFCPHHPDGRVTAYAKPCDCRKPAAGMLLRAAQKHQLDLSASWMIGDILHDVEAGRRAGCSTVLIDNGNETEWQMSPWREPHHKVADLAQAARVVVESVCKVREVV